MDDPQSKQIAKIFSHPPGSAAVTTVGRLAHPHLLSLKLYFIEENYDQFACHRHRRSSHLFVHVGRFPKKPRSLVAGGEPWKESICYSLRRYTTTTTTCGSSTQTVVGSQGATVRAGQDSVNHGVNGIS